MKNTAKFIFCVILCELVGSIGAVFTAMSVKTWYLQINKPSFNPPNWLFAPVWGILFFLMGVSLFLVWQKKGQKPIKKAITVFSVQFLFNIAWSMAFFGFHSPLAGLIVIIVLWLAIIWTMIEFYKISKPAGLLFTPYLLWSTFAAFLNATILYLN